MVFIYNIILRTTMGDRGGVLTVFINGSCSAAVIDVLGHSNILRGSFDEANQKLVLRGAIRNYMGPLQCICEAAREGPMILGLLKTNRGNIPFRGSEIATGGEENE